MAIACRSPRPEIDVIGILFPRLPTDTFTNRGWRSCARGVPQLFRLSAYCDLLRKSSARACPNRDYEHAKPGQERRAPAAPFIWNIPHCQLPVRRGSEEDLLPPPPEGATVPNASGPRQKAERGATRLWARASFSPWSQSAEESFQLGSFRPGICQWASFQRWLAD